MKNLVGFIGIGQCGGNITSLFQKDNFNTYYINTSLEDLATLKTYDYYHISKAMGSNHDRQKALEYIKDHYQKIIDIIIDHFKDQEIVYLVFSTGGGTGSGISPLLLDMLTAHCSDKVFGAVCVLPDLNESVNIQVNSYNCMTQLSHIKKLGSVFVLDNMKNNKESVNREFYNAFRSVINLYKHVSTRGNIDISEIKEVLSVRGVAVIAQTKSNGYTGLIKTLEDSCFAYQKDKKIVYAAISIKDDINIDGIFDYIGRPYDVFTNYNDNQSVACFSGMSFPRDRIQTIKTIVDNQREEVQSAIENARNSSIKNELQWNIRVNEKECDSVSFSDIFKKYQ